MFKDYCQRIFVVAVASLVLCFSPTGGCALLASGDSCQPEIAHYLHLTASLLLLLLLLLLLYILCLLNVCDHVTRTPQKSSRQSFAFRTHTSPNPSVLCTTQASFAALRDSDVSFGMGGAANFLSPPVSFLFAGDAARFRSAYILTKTSCAVFGSGRPARSCGLAVNSRTYIQPVCLLLVVSALLRYANRLYWALRATVQVYKKLVEESFFRLAC